MAWVWVFFGGMDGEGVVDDCGWVGYGGLTCFF